MNGKLNRFDARKQRAPQCQFQARSQNLSQRSSNAEDEAEAYYRQALESRQAMAAEVQDVKDDVAMQKRNGTPKQETAHATPVAKPVWTLDQASVRFQYRGASPSGVFGLGTTGRGRARRRAIAEHRQMRAESG